MAYLAVAAGITDVNPGLTFWTLVTFLLLAFVLGRYVWPRILDQIDERSRAIAGAIEAAGKERAEAEKRLAAAKEAELAARRQAAEDVRRIQAEGATMRDGLRQKAEREVAEMKSVAAREIGEERNRAAAELKSHAAELAIEAAKRLVALSMDDRQAKKVVDEFIDTLERADTSDGARARAHV